MNRYFKYFAIPFIITAVITVISLISYSSAVSSIDYERHNDSWDYTECVYDYAGKMTDEEVRLLNDYMIELQEACRTDMVLITLDEPEYGYLDKVRAYAEEVAEECSLGYDYPGGSSIVFVDNWSRGGDGGIHSWVATTGEVRGRLSDSDTESILNTLDDIPSDDADPYDQYCEIVHDLAKEAQSVRPPYSVGVAFIISLVIAGIYILIHLKSKVGDVTVKNSTYVAGGKGSFKVNTDTFRNKVVTKRKIERSSSSGGGGGSHGGGGHSR